MPSLNGPTKPRMSDETLQILRSRQARLTTLGKHPDWEELAAEVEREGERKKRTMVARVFGGGQGAPELPQREIDYLRGFMDGARWLLTVPRSAENRLENHLREERKKQ